MKGNLLNKCQLITYPDSLGADLSQLYTVLRSYLDESIYGVHILPFYPSSGDRGFSPLTYEIVDPRFGSWEDIDRIGSEYDLIVDFMLNHLSSESEQFKDFIKNGDRSEFADLFLRHKYLRVDADLSMAELNAVYTRRPRLPYIEIELEDGTKEKVWCTFGDDQIDLNVFSEVGRRFINDTLLSIAKHNVKMIRVDAFAYACKKLGSNCFFVEPDTSRLLGELRDTVGQSKLLLPEVHEHHDFQLALAKQGYYVYDFALPFLVLHTLYQKSNIKLKEWLTICPRKQITTLDTHDGLPVVDIAGILSAEEVELTKNQIFNRGANVSRRYSQSEQYQNWDIYQINCTYYSALGEDDDAYISARAIQFFTPGIPQVYYVGLLAGRNDLELVERTKVGRDINRHNFSLEEIEAEKERDVVKRLLKLMKFRNEHPAFNGNMTLPDSGEDELIIRWDNDEAQATLIVDLHTKKAKISYTDSTLKTNHEFMP